MVIIVIHKLYYICSVMTDVGSDWEDGIRVSTERAHGVKVQSYAKPNYSHIFGEYVRCTECACVIRHLQ